MTVDKWDRRALCDDGACTGVIGSDGTCKTCGKPSADFGDLRKPGRVSSKADVVEEEDETDAVEAPASPAKVAASASKVSTWNTRTLCPDGACVGVIGPDGLCKVCGTNAGAEAKGDVVEDDEEELEDRDDGEDADDGEEDEDHEGEDSDDEIAQDEEAGEEDDGEDENDDGDIDDDDESEDDEDNRKLCSDGACTGVIGDNGKCKVCGKAAA